MFITVAGALFAVFAANVLIGSTGRTVFLDDVSEMLVLFGATIAFVIAILRSEARAKNKQ